MQQKKLKLINPNLLTYIKSVSGLADIIAGKPITESDVKYLWAIKLKLYMLKTDVINSDVRKALVESMSIKSQTLYNKLHELKQKNLITEENKLHPLFSNNIEILIKYDISKDEKVKLFITG